jgi:hypothetical protein
MMRTDEEEAHVRDPTNEELVWSFAYGANMNRSSLAKRHVTPRQSLPAILNDYEFKFNMTGMMGNVQRCPGAEVHGIVHQLTRTDMCKLELVEGKGRVYNVEPLSVVTYNGEELQAFVFVGMAAMIEPGDGRPMERYRNIILQSAREFKLHERHIAHIESFDYIKSRTPDQYYRFSCPPRTAEYLYTPDRLAALLAELAEKRAAGGEVRTSVALLGDKVLRLGVSKEAADQFLPFMSRIEGKDFALWYCGAINEPSLPQAHSVEELTDRHYAWVEDQLLGEASKFWVENPEIIGYLA